MSIMTENEAINILQLNTPFVATKDVNEAVDMAIEALKKQSMVNEFIKEAWDYKLALFAVIRNPQIFASGRPIEEVNMLAVETMKKILGMLNFDKLKSHYSEAEEALAKMGGK